MRTTLFALACGTALLAGTAAFADETNGATAQPVAMTSSSDVKICKMFFHEGMLINTHECRTQREWDARRRSNEDDVQNFEVRAASSNSLFK